MDSKHKTSLRDVAMFVLISLYVLVMKWIKILIVNTPNFILEAIKPKARICVQKRFSLDSSSESEEEDAEELPYVVRKFLEAKTVSSSKCQKNGMLEVDIEFAAVVDNNGTFDWVGGKIACYSRIAKITTDFIREISGGRYLLLAARDADGGAHKLCVDLVKKKDLVNNQDILFSKINILLD